MVMAKAGGSGLQVFELGDGIASFYWLRKEPPAARSN